MDFYKVIQTRRSIRTYKKTPISKETLNKILEATRIAPSGGNHQPWKFVIVKNKALKQKMTVACNNQKFVAEAPVIIVALAEKLAINVGGYMGEMSTIMDTTIAFTHLILAARAEGLGTCWIGAFDNEQVKQLLNIPQEYNVAAITPLGYPTKKDAFTKHKGRKALNEIISRNKF